jgi:hypothetical protein
MDQIYGPHFFHNQRLRFTSGLQRSGVSNAPNTSFLRSAPYPELQIERHVFSPINGRYPSFAPLRATCSQRSSAFFLPEYQSSKVTDLTPCVLFQWTVLMNSDAPTFGSSRAFTLQFLRSDFPRSKSPVSTCSNNGRLG